MWVDEIQWNRARRFLSGICWVGVTAWVAILHGPFGSWPYRTFSSLSTTIGSFFFSHSRDDTPDEQGITVPNTLRCPVCMESRPSHRFPDTPYHNSHQPACNLCLARHVRIAANICACPDPDCSLELPSNLLESLGVIKRTRPKNGYRPLRTDILRCSVCLEHLFLSAFPNWRISTNCQHASRVCRSCLKTCITFDVKARRDPRCPECPAMMCHGDVRMALGICETLAAYEQYQEEKKVQTVRKWKWCVTCGHGEVYEGYIGGMVRCVRCGAKSCFSHRNDRHVGRTCQEVCRKLEAEEASLNRFSMKCPSKNCGIRIEKCGGCPRVECIKCGGMFRWALELEEEEEGKEEDEGEKEEDEGEKEEDEGEKEEAEGEEEAGREEEEYDLEEVEEEDGEEI